jgi:hypothetical protein
MCERAPFRFVAPPRDCCPCHPTPRVCNFSSTPGQDPGPIQSAVHHTHSPATRKTTDRCHPTTPEESGAGHCHTLETAPRFQGVLGRTLPPLRLQQCFPIPCHARASRRKSKNGACCFASWKVRIGRCGCLEGANIRVFFTTL